MNSDDVQTWRQKRMADFAAAMGGDKTAGQKLGFRDGAYIGQMVKGKRPITEKTIGKVQKIRGFDKWFDATVATETGDANATGARAVIRFDAAPTLADHLQGLGSQLLKLDEKGRKLAGTLLAEFALDPSDATQVAAMLQGALDAANAQEASGRRPEFTASQK